MGLGGVRRDAAIYSSAMKRKCVCVCAGSEIRCAIASYAVQCGAAGRARTAEGCGGQPAADRCQEERGWVVQDGWVWSATEGGTGRPAGLKRGHTGVGKE